VRDDAPAMDARSTRAADAFLRSVLSPAGPSAGDAPASEWRPWFSEWSLPLTAVTDAHLQAFLQDVATRTLDGQARRLAPTSIARTRAVVHAAFTCARKRRLIVWDPW
jgi:hypothetical protein